MSRLIVACIISFNMFTMANAYEPVEEFTVMLYWNVPLDVKHSDQLSSKFGFRVDLAQTGPDASGVLLKKARLPLLDFKFGNKHLSAVKVHNIEIFHNRQVLNVKQNDKRKDLPHKEELILLAVGLGAVILLNANDGDRD